MGELVLYTLPRCPYCMHVQVVIDELTLHYPLSIKYRDLKKEKHWRADLYAKTGRTQVPCLFVKAAPMFESQDIIRWLRKTYQTEA